MNKKLLQLQRSKPAVSIDRKRPNRSPFRLGLRSKPRHFPFRFTCNMCSTQTACPQQQHTRSPLTTWRSTHGRGVGRQAERHKPAAKTHAVAMRPVQHHNSVPPQASALCTHFPAIGPHATIPHMLRVTKPRTAHARPLNHRPLHKTPTPFSHAIAVATNNINASLHQPLHGPDGRGRDNTPLPACFPLCAPSCFPLCAPSKATARWCSQPSGWTARTAAHAQMTPLHHPGWLFPGWAEGSLPLTASHAGAAPLCPRGRLYLSPMLPPLRSLQQLWTPHPKHPYSPCTSTVQARHVASTSGGIHAAVNCVTPSLPGPYVGPGPPPPAPCRTTLLPCLWPRRSCRLQAPSCRLQPMHPSLSSLPAAPRLPVPAHHAGTWNRRTPWSPCIPPSPPRPRLGRHLGCSPAAAAAYTAAAGPVPPSLSASPPPLMPASSSAGGHRPPRPYRLSPPSLLGPCLRLCQPTPARGRASGCDPLSPPAEPRIAVPSGSYQPSSLPLPPSWAAAAAYAGTWCRRSLWSPATTSSARASVPWPAWAPPELSPLLPLWVGGRTIILRSEVCSFRDWAPQAAP